MEGKDSADCLTDDGHSSGRQGSRRLEGSASELVCEGRDCFACPALDEECTRPFRVCGREVWLADKPSELIPLPGPASDRQEAGELALSQVGDRVFARLFGRCESV